MTIKRRAPIVGNALCGLLFLAFLASCDSARPEGIQPETAGGAMASDAKPGYIVIGGTVLRADRKPSGDTTVFVGRYTNGRVTYDYKVDTEKGVTSGLANPNTKTDDSGGFRIVVDATWFETGTEYTLGAIDYGGNVAIPRAAGVPWGFTLTNSLREEARTSGAALHLGMFSCETCA